MSKNSAARARRRTGSHLPVAVTLAVALASCSRSSAVSPGFQGIIEYEERRLGFELGGRVAHVDVRRGDVVTKGKVLAALDDSLEQLSRAARADNAESARADVALLEAGARKEEVGSLAAQLRGAVASENHLRNVEERAVSLRDAGTISPAELDRTSTDLARATAERKSLEQRLAGLQRGARTEELARARARADAAMKELAMADERLARHALKARGPAQVLDVHVEAGEIAGPGAPVVTLADTSRPYAEVFVPQGNLDGIRAGVKAMVRVDAGDTALSGEVEHVAPRTEFTPRYIFSERERPNLMVRVRVRIDDPERKMHAGVPAFVTFAR